jgi:pantothenate kinase type III
MIQGVLGAIKSELEQEGEILQSVVQTGGESKNFHVKEAIIHPNLTLEGLALAFLEQQADKINEC